MENCMASKCEDCALKRPSFGLPAEGKRRWCGGCAKAHAGARNIVNKRCEDCALKTPAFGLPAEGKRRWCAFCASGHDGAINMKNKRPPLETMRPWLKRPRANAAAAPIPSHRPVKRERRAACQVDLDALRDDGTAIKSERTLASARPASAPTPAPTQHDDAHSLEADALQLLIANGARDLTAMLTAW